MWSCAFITKSTTKPFAPLFCYQQVCDVMLSSQNLLLNPLHCCSAFSLYVIWCFHHKIHCWSLCTLVLPSGSMWSSAFIKKSTAEACAPLFCPQAVCDLVLSSQNPLLNLLPPCSALSKYVMWCFHYKIHCWTLCTLFCPQEVCDLVLSSQNPLLKPLHPFLPSASMWSGAFITKSTAKPFAPLFCTQRVCDLAHSSKNPLLNLFHPCSALRKYVIWFFHHKSTAEPFAPLFHPQKVCDLVLSSQNFLLTLFWHSPTTSWHVASFHCL